MNKCLLEAIYTSLKAYKYHLNNNSVVDFVNMFHQSLAHDHYLHKELVNGEELDSDALHIIIPFICETYHIHLIIKLFYKEYGMIDPEEFSCTCDEIKRYVIIDYSNHHWSAHPNAIYDTNKQ